MRTHRIGIIGTGAIGGFYGLMLAKAGHDVHFLLRSDYEQVVSQGLRINSSLYGALQLDNVQAYRHAAEMPACDWLLVAAKTTSNLALLPAIVQVAAPGAKVVLLQNGLGAEEALRPHLPDSLHLLGGLCFICIHRTDQGIIEHQAMNGINLAYHSGPLRDPAQQWAVTQELAETFSAAGLAGNAMTDLATARWQKLVWNVPYNGLSVLLNSGTEGLMKDANSLVLIKAIMQEVMAAAHACGHPLPDDLAENMLKNTLQLPDYLPSMYHDFQLKRPMELEAIYLNPLARAAQVGAAMPKTEMLLDSLRFLEARSGAY